MTLIDQMDSIRFGSFEALQQENEDVLNGKATKKKEKPRPRRGEAGEVGEITGEVFFG